MKLALNVVVVLFIGSTAKGTSPENGYQISYGAERHVQHLGEVRMASQARHRLRMLFPLLLRISSRLAQIVPMALAAVVATFVMALFAKKAFIISLAAFGLMLYDTFKKKEHHVVHYVAEPSHENHVNTYHFTEPQKYTAYSDDGHSYDWNEHYGGRKVYEDDSSSTAQNIQQQ